MLSRVELNRSSLRISTGNHILVYILVFTFQVRQPSEGLSNYCSVVFALRLVEYNPDTRGRISQISDRTAKSVRKKIFFFSFWRSYDAISLSLFAASDCAVKTNGYITISDANPA